MALVSAVSLWPTWAVPLMVGSPVAAVLATGSAGVVGTMRTAMVWPSSQSGPTLVHLKLCSPELPAGNSRVRSPTMRVWSSASSKVSVNARRRSLSGTYDQRDLIWRLLDPPMLENSSAVAAPMEMSLYSTTSISADQTVPSLVLTTAAVGRLVRDSSFSASSVKDTRTLRVLPASLLSGV